MRIPLLLRLAALCLFTSLAAQNLHAQQQWRWANPLPAGQKWNAVAHGAGLYVVVGGDSMIVTSPDGVEWTIRRHSISNTVLNNVLFADGKFVAVGQGLINNQPGGALVLTSTDGITWTQATLDLNAQLFSVVYGNGVWMVSGLSSPAAVATSTDLVTWTTRGVTGGDGAIRGAYGNGRFVFLNDQNRVNYTTDNGITWTRSYVVGNGDNSNVSFHTIVYAGDRFYAAGRGSDFNAAVYSSQDGVTWTATAASVPNSNGGVYWLAHADGEFVMAGNTSLFTSDDAITWTKQTSAMPSAYQIPETFSGVGIANDTFFALGIYGSITTSADGVTWTRPTTGTVHNLAGIVHDGTGFVVTGTGGTVLTSDDGTTWTSVDSGRTSDFGELAFGAGRFATAGRTGGFHSANLTSWTPIPGTNNNEMFGVIYANDRFIAANNGLALGVHTSTDGNTWTSVSLGAPAGTETKGLAGGGGNFVITTAGFGPTPKIYASADGTTWTDRTPQNFSAPNSLAYGNGRFVLLTGSHVWTSSDGVSWTSQALPSASYVTSVFFVGDRFLARSNSIRANYKTSTDGVTWTDFDSTTAPNFVLSDFIAHEGLLLGIGGGGVILQSDLDAVEPEPEPEPEPAVGRLSAISLRAPVGTGDNVLIAGYVIGSGEGSLPVLVRAIGPTLSTVGVPLDTTLQDPQLAIVPPGQTVAVASNDDWSGDAELLEQSAALGTTPFMSNTSTDAAVYLTGLAPGPYTAVVSGKNNGTGIGLVEVYAGTDEATAPRLTAIAGRSVIGAGNDVLIAGFAIRGGSTRVMVRGVGPSIPGNITKLADPQIALHAIGETTAMATNDDWGAAANAGEIATLSTQVGATALTANSKDAALLLELEPGVYTAVLSGVNATSGIGLIEVYEVP